MSILGAIANPQIADIAGALDYREKRLQADEAKRKEIRMGQLVAEALPNIREGSPLYELARDNPREFSVFAKAFGIPLNAGDKVQQLADDVGMLYTLAQDSPEAAFQQALDLKDERNQSGMDTPQLDQWINSVREDPQQGMSALFLMHRSINGEGMSESEKLAREKFEFEKAQGPRMGEGTANQKDWQEYQRLLQEDPEAAEKFGRAAGFSSKEGTSLSAFAEKQLASASDEYTSAASAASRYTTLADKLRKASMSGGLASKWTEYLKEQSGNQDEITALRKEALAISNSEAIKNLPPGPATDRDIEIVMAPFPTEKAAPEYVANWLGAMARLNEKRAEYAEFKSDFIGRTGSLRDRDGTSLTRAWKNSQEKNEPQKPAAGQASQAPATTKQGGTIMVDANGNRAMVYPDGSFEELQ